MSYHADKLVIDTHRDPGNDNARRLKLALGKKKWVYPLSRLVIGEGNTTSVTNANKLI